MTDGRKARGEARRRQLIHATLDVIARDGLAGLTHRAIAEQAGVSLASASYHFAGIDELAATALEQVTDELVQVLSTEGDHSLARLAHLLAAEIVEHRAWMIAGYELYLLAIRRPHLRPQAVAWLDVIADTFAPHLTGPRRQAFQATIEGVTLHSLLRDTPYTAAQIETMLTLTEAGDG